MSVVEDLEALYPYLRGHTFIRVAGARSPSCALCGAFQSAHPPERQGSLEVIPVAEVQSILAEIQMEHERNK